jgi:hypothetical protein
VADLSAAAYRARMTKFRLYRYRQVGDCSPLKAPPDLGGQHEPSLGPRHASGYQVLTTNDVAYRLHRLTAKQEVP